MFSMTRWGRYLGQIAATFLLLVLPIWLHATHIVGGEITYRSLGNNRYEITLRVYRDCINGQVDFDDPASVGVFDRDGTLLQELRLPFVSKQPASNPLDACLTSTGLVCVETTTYITTVTLLPIVGGYRFAYQRCCRNRTIKNIINPLETGATYDILLTEAAMARANNSPRFSEQWPPVYICAGLPFTFNHSAIDVDGDSLVYSLCAPFQGATFAQPLPQPPMPPPYDEVQFLTSGGYSLNNVLGGSRQALRIRSNNGLMTAFPEIVGQFVVGVCVEEFDRKTKKSLSITRRDFQYNVVPCEKTTAAFVSPAAQCDTLQVKFQNNSTKATNFKWFFDSPKNTLTSILRDPVFTFPDTGRYRIALIAEPGAQCTDTAYANIFLQKNSLQAKVKADAVQCNNESILQVEDLSSDKVSGIASRLWEVTLANGQKFTDTGIKPTFRLPLGANGTLKLTVKTVNGCTQVVEQAFNTQNAPNPTTFIADTLKACIGTTIALNPNTPASTPWTYKWSPVTGLDNPDAINPKLLVSGNATYTVTLTSPSNVCQLVKVVTILSSLKPKAAFTAPLSCDGFTVQVNNTSTNARSYQWTVGNPRSPLFQSTLTSPSFVFRDTGTFVITLAATSFCSDTARQTVRVTGKRLKTDFTTTYESCVLGGSTILFRDNSANLDTLGAKWSWILADGRTASTKNAVFSFSQGTTTNVTLIVTSANGCKDTMSRSVLVAPIASINYPDTVTICSGGSVTLNTSNSPAFVYQWSPNQGINNPQVVNPTFSPTQTTTYTVNVSISGQPTCQISDKILALVSPAIGLQATGGGTLCADQTTLIASSANPATYRWLDANGNVLGTGPQLLINTLGEQRIQLSAVNARGCVENRTVTVNLKPFKPGDLTSPQTICQNTPTGLNPNGNAAYQYTWFPTAGLNLSNPQNPIATLANNTTFKVTVVDPVTGCQAEKEVVVNVRKIAGFAASADTTLCASVAITIRATAGTGVNIRWVDAGGNALGSGTSISVTPKIGTNQYIAVASDEVCFARDTVNVRVQDFKPGDLTSPQDICANTPTGINPNGNAAYRYTWSPATGLNLSNPQNPIATLTSSITYKVTVLDAASGCSVTKDVVVNVRTLGAFAASADTTLCSPSSITLRATAGTTTSIRWVDGAGNTLGTGTRLTVTPKIGANQYIAIASDGVCSGRDTVNVRVQDFKPGDLTSPQDICANTPTGINPNGNAAYQYTWSPTTGLNLANPQNPIATLASSTTFKVTVTDSATGCRLEKNVTVNVSTLGGFNAGRDTTLCQAATITLKVTTASGVTVRWVDPAGVALGTGVRLQVTPRPGANQYIAIGTDGVCTLRDTVNVKLENFKPGDLASPQEVCIDSPTALNPNGNPAYRYTWTPTTGLNLSNPFNPIVQVLVNTTYKVTVTDPATGCTLSKDILVTVRQPTTVVASPDTTLCAPGQINLRATSSRAGVITWYRDRNLTQVIGTGNRITVPGVAGKNVFYAAIRDTSDVCYKAGKGGIGNPGGGSGGTGGGGTSLNGVPGDSAVVNIIDITKVGPPADLTVCRNVATPLNPNANPNFTYQWAPPTGLSSTTTGNPSVTTSTDVTYTVTITSNNGLCTTVQIVRVKPAAPINPDAGRDTLLCSLNPFTLIGKGTGATRFEWSLNRNFNPTLGQGSPFQITPTAGSRFYYLRVTNATGCPEIDSIKINTVPVQATIPAILTACVPGEEIPVDVVNNDPTQTLRYAWTPVNLILSNPAVGPRAIVKGEDNGKIQVLLTNQVGCQTTLSSTINIVDLANKVKFTLDKGTIKVGESAKVTVSGCTNCTFEWTPTTGVSDPRSGSPTLSPTKTAEYRVKVTSGKCMAEFTVKVVVETPCAEPYIFVPNSFTPNGDGQNDYFRVRGQDITSFEFVVYNRWGQQMYRSTDPNDLGWDGTFQGKALPSDVYGYYVVIQCKDGTFFRKQGNVTLFR